jgi:antitoxin ParD1/3/4
MPKMSLELTDSLQSFVDSASIQQGFVSSNEYVLHVLQKEQDRDRVRALIDEGEASPSRLVRVEDYIASLRKQIAIKKDL